MTPADREKGSLAIARFMEPEPTWGANLFTECRSVGGWWKLADMGYEAVSHREPEVAMKLLKFLISRLGLFKGWEAIVAAVNHGTTEVPVIFMDELEDAIALAFVKANELEAPNAK